MRLSAPLASRVRETVTPLLGASLLFYGTLANRTDLHTEAERAIRELRERGYSVPTGERPLKIRALSPTIETSPHLAGGWSRGDITLRRDPVSAFGESTYLRHEIMHEAYHRTCDPMAPEWEQEAAAIAFSGEAVTLDDDASNLSDEALKSLKKVVRFGGTLSARHRATLTKLVREHGWPSERCSRSEPIRALLEAGDTNGPSATNQPNTTGAKRAIDAPDVIHLDIVSGRILGESDREYQKGSLRARLPIGSLQKIPIASSILPHQNPSEIGRALVRSDTRFFEQALAGSARARVCEIFSQVLDHKDEALLRCPSMPAAVLAGESAPGEKPSPFSFSLREAARLIRLSILSTPESFSRIPAHSEDSSATLYRTPSEFHRLLLEHGAWAKTGSVTSSRGEPQWGYLVVVWPRSEPRGLVMFRSRGVRGAQIGDRITKDLKSLMTLRPRLESRPVEVPLLSPVPRAAYTVEGECAGDKGDFSEQCLLSVPNSLGSGLDSGNEKDSGGYAVTSPTGVLRVTTSVKNARPVRFLQGILINNARSLITDPLSYVEGVLSAEGDGLPSAVREALRGVIYWNTTQGEMRHTGADGEHATQESRGLSGGALSDRRRGLCDTTHCMVFMGMSTYPSIRQHQQRASNLLKVDSQRGGGRELLRYLQKVFEAQGSASAMSPWFEYSTGGIERWRREIKLNEVATILGHSSLSDVRRVRDRSGAVSVRIEMNSDMGTSTDTFSCDTFVNKLDLPSCPNDVTLDSSRTTLYLAGIGKGHGRGLNLAKATLEARGGATALSILQDAFPIPAK